MNVSILDSPSLECDHFVRGMAAGKLCHMPAWTHMIEKTFGHKGFFLIARKDGAIDGVLPLTHIGSKLFGNRMISQPFSDYGGPLAKTPATLNALYQRAVELTTQYGCDSMELRSTAVVHDDLHLRTDKVSMCLPLASGAERVWENLRPQIRNRIRKGEKSGIHVINGHIEMLEEFYRIWTIRMHQLGTPCYAKKLFHSILETFANNTKIFLAILNGTTIAVLFAYTFNGCVYTRWGAALRGYDAISPNYLLNWSAIEFYSKQGMKWFDFGRSTLNSGQYIFKKRWGAEPIQLCWQYWIRPNKKLHLVKPDDPRYRKKVEIWRKLPLWLTRLVGPHISCSLP